jgi:hypothetical protein
MVEEIKLQDAAKLNPTGDRDTVSFSLQTSSLPAAPGKEWRLSRESAGKERVVGTALFVFVVGTTSSLCLADAVARRLLLMQDDDLHGYQDEPSTAHAFP